MNSSRYPGYENSAVMYQSTNAVFTQAVLRKTPVWNNAEESTVKADCTSLPGKGNVPV